MQSGYLLSSSLARPLRYRCRHLSSLRALPSPLGCRNGIGGFLHRPLPLALHAFPRDFHVDCRQTLKEETAPDLGFQEFHNLSEVLHDTGRRGEQAGACLQEAITMSDAFVVFVGGYAGMLHVPNPAVKLKVGSERDAPLAEEWVSLATGRVLLHPWCGRRYALFLSWGAAL